MLNTARVEANDPNNLYTLLVWDEKPTGDGPGGTSDFAMRVKKLSGHRAIINPTKLKTPSDPLNPSHQEEQ